MRSYVYQTSFVDQLICETVCRIDKRDIVSFIQANHPQIYDGLQVSEVLEVEHGLVLVDGYGRGAFQK